MIGPQLAFSDDLHARKYRGEGESFREGVNRVASALQDNDDHYHHLRDIFLHQRFLPAGRVQSAVGSTRQVTPYNCYVSGTIEDSLVEGNGSIMQRLHEAAATMRMGGGIGYDFSELRPHGDAIKTQHTQASGPVSFMPPFDAVCKTIASSGHRRGAQMAVLRIDHPDIEKFIHAKQNTDSLTAFNISIAVTDEFMQAVVDGTSFALRYGGTVYREVDARTLWEMIMRSTWDWAEPGVLFIDQINRMNNLWYCEVIAATNPCGEQPLPPYGACLLGSSNLVKYLKQEGKRYIFDWDQFGADIPHIVRAMDNVVDLANYPLYEQKKEAKSKRRMGLGITGLANCVEALGFEYGSPGFVKYQADIQKRLLHGCYRASIELAKEKGAFSMFDKQQYLSGQFIKTLPEDIRDEIAEHGIRNSHLTSIAPTGTISMTADNVSSGIEPVFAYSFERTIQEFEGARVERIEDYGVRVLGVKGKRSRDVTVQEHLSVLSTAFQYVDSSVSKTCNVPGDTSWDDFKNIYIQAWKEGCKGCTTFRMDGRREGILAIKDEDSQVSDSDVLAKATNGGSVVALPGAACYTDPMTGRKECE